MPEKRSVYWDYNAATPLDSQVREAMNPFWAEVFGNPSSIHARGRQARACLDDARERAAQLLGCKPSEILFTSGGTEACNLAILGAARAWRAKGRHLVTTRIEHHAVLEGFRYLEKQEGFEVTYVPADERGVVSPQCVLDALRKDTILVSVMAANNETGAVQPIQTLGKLCRERGIGFHTDAVQWFGKMPWESIHDFQADLVCGCAHKFHGPKGAGFLFVRSPLKLQPLILGGPQENEMRAGTENLAQIVGLVAALERFMRPPVFASPAIVQCVAELETFLAGFDCVRLIQPQEKLPNTLAFIVKGCTSLDLLANLDLEGIQASAGAACMSGALQPSHVLLGMGFTPAEANSLVRLSLGRENTLAEVEYFKRVFPEVLKRCITTG